MSLPLTRSLARFAVAPGFDAVPDDVLQTVRNGFIDTVATLLSGRDEPVTRAALAFATRRSAAGVAPALLGRARLDAAGAAFVDGVSAHALDYDDMALNGHPSVVLVPALLAAGAACDADDASLLRAYLVGYETWAELARREPDALHGKGWHPTSVVGTVAGAAAVSHLRGVDDAVATHALGIAASLACGLMGNFGSMTKPLHAGWAASHALEAVDLAMLGVTAQPDVLESRTGFLAAFSPAGRADRGEWTPPQELRIRRNGLSIKKYPICYASHRVVDGVLDLRRRHGLTADDVDRIDATISDVTARVLHSHAPRTALEGKFSLEFAAAAAVCCGAVGLPQVTDDVVMRADVQRLAARVTIGTVPAGCPIEKDFALNDSVTLHLRDGRSVASGPIRFARGHALAPLPAEELRAKFLGCVAADERERAAELHDALAAVQGGTRSTLRAALARFGETDR